MNRIFSTLGGALAALLLFAGAPGQAAAANTGQVCITVANLLERGHFSRQQLDDELSRKVFDKYIEKLDYNRMFFTADDVSRLRRKFALELDDYILLGNPKPAFDVFDLYAKRVKERVAAGREFLKEPFDFKSGRTITLSREESKWAGDEEEALSLWRDKAEGDLLLERLNDHATEDPVTVVDRRYRQVLRNVTQQTREDVLALFLSSLSQVYDPHSEYLSPSELETFEINMRLSLVGIGAVLRSDDGYARIIDLVPGGPADLDGRLQVDDRIVAVAQGNGEFVDVVETKLDKVVERIRGKKGTTVRLLTIPSNATDPSEREVISIVRDKVNLKEQEARAEIIDRIGAHGRPERLAVITLPSFYADMQNSGSRSAKSTAQDVNRLLKRLKTERIDGLVLDLRRNGGGSLEEAIKLSGLFIRTGPIVQSKDTHGNIRVSSDRDRSIAYEGPMVVMTSRLSASASEIFAAAMQDYRRAVIVGDRNTFGKGTVQTMLEIGRFMPMLGGRGSKAGALKLTIQKFYRVAGGSTQLHGVMSDIVLPSLTDQKDIGESSLDNPLAYDEVPGLSIRQTTDSLFIGELRRRSQIRVAGSREFGYVREDIKLLQDKIEATIVSLNEDRRRKELKTDKERKERRLAERKARKKPTEKVYLITLDDVESTDLQPIANSASGVSAPSRAADPGGDEDDDEDEEDLFDAEREEALNILSDLVELSLVPKTAQVGN